jgi:hypothetical protein
VGFKFFIIKGLFKFLFGGYWGIFDIKVIFSGYSIKRFKFLKYNLIKKCLFFIHFFKNNLIIIIIKQNNFIYNFIFLKKLLPTHLKI